MIHNRKIFVVSLRIIILSQIIASMSCGDKKTDELVLLTEIPAGSVTTVPFANHFPHARIVAFDISKPVRPVRLLTAEFNAAMSPEVSFDGKRMLFCAQKSNEDRWQIWEMDIKTQQYRQVTDCKENCFDPAYLPGGRCVFSKRPKNVITGKEKALFVCNLDGSEMQQITFHPHTDIHSSVMMDGRIITASKQVFPEPAQTMLMVMRPDGTKAEMFYQGPEGSEPGSRAWERPDGMVFFTESVSGNPNRGSVIAVNQNRPLHTRKNLSSDTTGSFRYIFPLMSGRCLVSYRPSEKEHYGLYLFDPETGNTGEPVFRNSEYHIIEAVTEMERLTPRNLPSEVDESKKTGIYFCQDINLTGLSSENMAGEKAVRVRLTGIDKILGKVRAEKDGSLHLKILANTPFRIQTLDEKGDIVNGPSAWIWIRPNERRGCAGCHQDPELAPENRPTLSVQRPPVMVPSEESADDEEHIVE